MGGFLWIPQKMVTQKCTYRSVTMARKNELQMFEKISITKKIKKDSKHNDDWKRARKLQRKTKLNIQERSFV